MRGAIEFCRSAFRKDALMATGKEEKPLKPQEPRDSILFSMLTDQTFKNMLTEACSLNKIRVEDVTRCLGGLYHTASKQHHGRRKTDKVSIHLDSWSSNEVICLEVLFDMYDIPCHYFNSRGEECSPPHALR